MGFLEVKPEVFRTFFEKIPERFLGHFFGIFVARHNLKLLKRSRLK